MSEVQQKIINWVHSYKLLPMSESVATTLARVIGHTNCDCQLSADTITFYNGPTHLSM